MTHHDVCFDVGQASTLARLALDCIQREYPNKLDHVINTPGDVQSPRALHPAFYGCFDWHSAVHGHWMLIRLLKTFPTLGEAAEVRARVSINLSSENIAGELDYLRGQARDTFERTYGWAWLLKLAEELHGWDDGDGQRWSGNLEPLAAAFIARFAQFLPKQAYPIRVGLHANTAFALAFAWDYATSTGNSNLAGIIRERSMTYFAADANYPAHLEPEGEDFFSPSLIEADLMRRVMPPNQFQSWFGEFLPGMADDRLENLMTPAEVADRADGRMVHLDGLNFSRAWCMRNIGSALADHDRARTRLSQAADAHAADALSHLSRSDYAGHHWLGSFAVYMLSTPDPERSG